jgi:hypothetical protein
MAKARYRHIPMTNLSKMAKRVREKLEDRKRLLAQRKLLTPWERKFGEAVLSSQRAKNPTGPPLP